MERRDRSSAVPHNYVDELAAQRWTEVVVLDRSFFPKWLKALQVEHLPEVSVEGILQTYPELFLIFE